ncbi:Uncharacterised protein [uncultured archaeon]|nr:Uncharacterised protein [uncultured archaeon]
MNMEKEDAILVFDEPAKARILKALDLKPNAKQELADKENKILTNAEYESIHIQEFGGILRGSKIAIKKDKTDLVRYFVTK